MRATTHEEALLVELAATQSVPQPNEDRVKAIKAELARVKGDAVETTVAPEVEAEADEPPAKVERAVRKKAH